MQRSGHVGIGLFRFAPVALGLTWSGRTAVLPAGLLGVLMASTAPDLDKIVPHIAHRGITHTLLAAVVTGIVYGLVAPSISAPGAASSGASLGHPRFLSLAAGLLGFLGVVGHLAGDVLTPRVFDPGTPSIADTIRSTLSGQGIDERTRLSCRLEPSEWLQPCSSGGHSGQALGSVTSLRHPTPFITDRSAHRGGVPGGPQQ